MLLDIYHEIRSRRDDVRNEALASYQARVAARPITPAEQLGLVSRGLDVAGWKDDPMELFWIAEDPARLLVLLELARGYVDASKTLSARAIPPSVALNLLLKATEAVEVVYHNEKIQRVIEMNPGLLGAMAIEMLRDKAKLLRSAAAPFYMNGEREHLLEVAGGIMGRGLRETDQPNEKEGLYALLQIEEQLAISASGRLADWSIVERELPTLVSIYGKNNPERLATILMQLSARDVEILVGSASLNRTVKEELQKILDQHPNCASKYNVMAERRRRLLQLFKMGLTPTLSIGMRSEKEALYKRLLSWEKYNEKKV